MTTERDVVEAAKVVREEMHQTSLNTNNHVLRMLSEKWGSALALLVIECERLRATPPVADLNTRSISDDGNDPSRLWRKKPVVVEAWRFRSMGQFEADAPEWLKQQRCLKVRLDMLKSGHVIIDSEKGSPVLFIGTLEGTMNAMPGDWILRGIKGELYPVKPDIFAATYEAVTSPTGTTPDAGGSMPSNPSAREKVLETALLQTITDIESEPVCCGIPRQQMGRNGPEQECCGSPEYGWERAIQTARAAFSTHKR